MNFKLLMAAATTSFAFAAIPASALTFVLDDFTDEQLVVDEPNALAPNSSTIFGGSFTPTSRTLTVENTQVAGGSSSGATQLESFGGVLRFDNASGARGTGTVRYDGVGDLRNTLSKGFFFFDVIDFDGGATFELTGEDEDGTVINYFELLTASFNPVLRFTEIAGAEDFDFSNVRSLEFAISSSETSDSIDGRLGSITVSAVPLPASGLLLLGAVGGAAALRRRKSRKVS